MALDIGRLLSDIYSGLSSPSAGWARRDMALEKKKALDEENQRKIDLQKEIDIGATGRVELTNTGALARQALANTGAERVADITGKASVEGHRLGAEATLGGERERASAAKYTADQNLIGTQYSADNPKSTVNNELTAKYFEAMNQPGANRDQLTADFESLRRGNKLGGGLTTTDDAKAGIPAFVKPDLPAPGRAAVPETVTPPPIRGPGARSMEFRSGPDPAVEEQKRKRMNKIYFQGTKYE